MKQLFKIIDFENTTLILPLSNKRFDEVLIEVEHILINKKHSGEIMFDLLISNGLSKNRFINIRFNESKLDFTTLAIVTNASSEIIDMSNRFYAKKRKLIDESILARSEKYKIIEQLKRYSLTKHKSSKISI